MQYPPDESSNSNPENWQPQQQPPNTYYPPQLPQEQPMQSPQYWYPQPGPQYQPMIPPPPQKSKRVWIIAGIVIGALFLCGVISNGLPKSATTDTTTITTTTQQSQATDTPF